MKNKIANRIQKLLKLAESSNENEAKLAAEKANELLMRYNLTNADIERQASDYGYIDIYTGRTKVEDKFINTILAECFFVKAIYTQNLVYQIVTNEGETIDIDSENFVETMTNLSAAGAIPAFKLMGTDGRAFKFSGSVKKLRTQTLKIFGENFNAQIAEYMYSFLYYQFKTLWKAYKKANGATEKEKQAYYLGLMTGIIEQLKARKHKVERETGLVVLKDRQLEKFFARDNPNVSRRSAKFGTSEKAQASGFAHGREMQIRQGIKNERSSNMGKLLN